MNITPDYLTGFCEGEGAFTFSRQKRRWGYCVNPRFSLRQRGDGKDVLAAIQAFWKVGLLYDCKARGQTQFSAYFFVASKDELPVVVKHFVRYPLLGAGKLKVFEVWAELVAEYTRKDYGADYVALDALARKLSKLQLRPRGFIHRVVKANGKRSATGDNPARIRAG